ncbi:MAG: hypothetical protein ABNH21_05955 [Glaciecola sp.]|jgi:hypothetical protein
MTINNVELSTQALMPMHFASLSSLPTTKLAHNSVRANLPLKRWVAHVSDKTQLVSAEELVLQLSPTASLNAFDIIEKLLFAKTCRIIHTDAQFSLNQIAFLKEMALFSGTDLVFIGDKERFNRKQMLSLEKA